MKHLREIIIASLIGLTLLFNIERLDFGRENIIDIDSFVYILGIIAAISIITLPILRRKHVAISLGLWLGLYLFSKLFIFNQRPLVGGIYTYLSITEVTLVGISIWLSHLLARAIHDFEQAVENITLRSASRRVRRPGRRAMVRSAKPMAGNKSGVWRKSASIAMSARQS